MRSSVLFPVPLRPSSATNSPGAIERSSPRRTSRSPKVRVTSLAKTAVFDPVSVLAGVASPVYDAAGNYVMPAMNGEMAPADAAKQMRDDLKGQAK